MPRGISAKREHEYEDFKEKFEDEGRYKGREEEVAARIVNKQRAEHSETQNAKADDKSGASPDSDLPILKYDHLTVSQIASHTAKLSARDIQKLRDYEANHRARKTVLEQYDRAIEGHKNQ